MHPVCRLLITSLLANAVLGQSSQSYSEIPETVIPSYLLTPIAPSTSEYDANLVSSGSFAASNATATSSSSSESVIAITGATPTTVSNNTAASTSSSRPQPTNSQPCNGYVEFCNRRLSNVSMVVAHNSPFVLAHNAASNQVLQVETQLNDGIRGLQFETHMANGTLQLCHTSCNLLDVGTLESYLSTVATWLAAHPFEVIAIMMGNDDRVAPTNYVAPFQNAGLLPYLYEPSNTTLTLDQWPTLAEMIIRNKRVVVMLDYLANQTEVPWLLDEFSYQWETPFSPTDPAFPCTEQRPPKQSEDVSRNKMYMANHNLNIAITIGSDSLLIPAYSLLDGVNAVSGNGSLGRMMDNCTGMWNRPPNWLLVDYYNFGNFNGSVFQVAADANNVTYNRASCCGTATTSGSVSQRAIKFNAIVVVCIAILAGLL
ncbi:PLC-like phosphodiesterase [Lophiostoma macrostomum CBS 122681]|uniref:PLC-like phosphodiesterase n=1 Tax=Lophiostoma macrostomum CBS 122681 TaxID=1314788 RepID=A0A6A6TKX3_9PLEO|nr:PLC-like phosphodiesterase [Lophiostoma macrostomum CBS 122681]